MFDSFGRKIDYVRVSITDRCNLRCVYCMPEEGVEKLAHRDILSYEDILRCCRAFARLGVVKIKVTGGEPLIRKDAVDFIRELKRMDGIECVTLTTNGILLPRFADELKSTGLDGVNISLDSLDEDAYHRITLVGDLSLVLEGIDAALNAGIPNVKINCVPIAGMDGQNFAQVASLAKSRDIQVRFIEMMPVGLGACFEHVDNREIRRRLELQYGSLTPCGDVFGNGPARYVSLPGFKGKIGFIGAVGSCFCERCNRVRLTSDGFLKSCLHHEDGLSLMSALENPDDERLLHDIREAILLKPERHSFGGGISSGCRIMSQIGG